jgi:iron complex transport system substrate-binding protein
LSAGVAAAKSGVIPALSRSCDAPSGASQVACATPSEKALGGRAVRTAIRARFPLSPPNAEVELVRSKTLLPLVLVGLIVAGACAKEAAPRPAAVSFPLKVTAANGTVTIQHVPSRIVSLSATATEDLFAVGAGSQVVAVDSYSTYPANAPRTKLSAFTPNVEAIANYRPDLVVVSDDTNHIVSQLEKLSIPVLVEPVVVDLNGAYGQIEQLAQATGHTADGQRVVADMKNQIQSIVRSMPKPAKKLSVYHELDQTYYSATSHTFIGQIYRLLGIDDIADKAGRSGDYPQLSAEYIIASNPDLIVLADTVCCGQTAKTVAARAGWRGLTAVKNGGVVPVDDSIASEWGPRIVLFVKAVAEAVKKVEGNPA